MRYLTTLPSFLFCSVPNHNYISFTSWLLCLPLFLASIQRYARLKACRSEERVKVSSSCFYQPPLHKSSQLCDQAFGGKANQTGWKRKIDLWRPIIKSGRRFVRATVGLLISSRGEWMTSPWQPTEQLKIAWKVLEIRHSPVSQPEQ